MNKRFLTLLLLLITFLFPIVKAENNDIYDYNHEEIYQYTYKNDETGFSAVIEDDASLLTESEKQNLLEEMKKLTAYGHIAFVSIDINPSSTSSYARDYYHSFYGKESGSIFLIDMDNREIYIFSDGNNFKSISTSKAYSITDNAYKYSSNEEYYQCASKALEQMYLVLDGYRIIEPMRYASNLFIALTISFFLSFLIVLAKTKIKKASINEIIQNCDVHYNIGDISAIKTGTHRVYNPPSSSSGGSSFSGGGGGSFGGGGSSGGGGGHRF